MASSVPHGVRWGSTDEAGEDVAGGGAPLLAGVAPSDVGLAEAGEAQGTQGGGWRQLPNAGVQATPVDDGAAPNLTGTGADGLVRGAVHLPDLPDGLEAWTAARSLFSFWLTLSIVNIFAGFLFGGPILFVAGVIGTVGASMHVCGCCGGGPSIAGPSRAIFWVAISDAIVAGIASLLQLVLVFVFPQGAVRIIFNLVLALTTVSVSVTCARRAKGIIRLLEPVSSGIAVV